MGGGTGSGADREQYSGAFLDLSTGGDRLFEDLTGLFFVAPPLPDCRSQPGLVQPPPRRLLVEILDVRHLDPRRGLHGVFQFPCLLAGPVDRTFEGAHDLPDVRARDDGPPNGPEHDQEREGDQEGEQPATPTTGIAVLTAGNRRRSNRFGGRVIPSPGDRGRPAGDAIEVGDELRRARVPGPGVLRQKLEDYGIDLFGDLAPYVFGGTGRLVHLLHGDGDRRVGLERHLAGEHLVEDDAQGVEVARGPHLPPHRLLWRHVDCRTQDDARLGDLGRSGGPRYAEVGHLYVARGVHEHVLRLYVPVDHAPLVRSTQRVGDLDGHGRGGAGGQGPFPNDAFLERPAGDVLHRDVVAPVLRGAPVVDLDDVRVGERRHAQGLATEPLDELLVLGVLVAEHLEGHVPLQELVAGQVHLGHASAAQGAQDDVAVVYRGGRLHGHCCTLTKLSAIPDQFRRSTAGRRREFFRRS